MLDNTAKLSDIISALQGIEGINAKADLASVVGSPATASDTMAAINAVIQQAKNDLAAKLDDSNGTEPLQALIDKLFVGKKWASGNAYSANDRIPATRAMGGVVENVYYTTVDGLNFKPSIIIISSHYLASGDARDFTLLMPVNLPLYQLNAFEDRIISGRVSPSGNIANCYIYKLKDNMYVNNDGFRLPTGTLTNVYKEWMAIE